jgi:hypothetical protein
VSDEHRFIHDARKINLRGHKHDHPPALQPRHRGVARRILWWKIRHPASRILLAKRDIDSAFKLIWLWFEDAGSFANEVPGDVLGLIGAWITAISVVLTFGYHGSPGEYSPWGYALKQFHEAHVPADPTWHDDVPFSDATLVDDTILIEPELGLRPQMSGACFGRGARLILGPNAINIPKLAEEGEYDVASLIWGIAMNTESEMIALPEVKIGKIRDLVRSSDLDHGHTCLTEHAVQSLAGTLQHASVPCPALRAELGAIYCLLRHVAPGSRNIQVTGAHAAAVWAEFWGFVEFTRILVEIPSMWTTHFTSGLRAMLSVGERLALPGEHERIIWTGGDSTLERAGAADWDAKVFGHVLIRDVIGRLNTLASMPE